MIRLLIAGNSIALHVEPKRRTREDGAYAELLRRRVEALGGCFRNEARHSGVISEDNLLFMSAVQQFDPDAVVLHYGINEAAPRALPRSWWLWLKEPQPYLPAKSLFRRAEAKLEPYLVRAFRCGGWMGPREFERHLVHKVRKLRSEAAAVPLLMNMGPAGDWLEGRLPGMSRAVARFNEVFERVCRREGAVLVDVHALVERQGIAIQPDGCHFTEEGHRQVRDLVWSRLREQFPALPEHVPCPV